MRKFVAFVEWVKLVLKMIRNFFLYRIWGADAPPEEDKIIYFIDRQKLQNNFHLVLR